MIVSYRGCAYSGFQKQPGADTIQTRLEAAVQAVVGRPVAVRGAGRTDAGVHAAGQVVDAWLPREAAVAVQRLPLALTRQLPADIAVAAAWEVSPSFHPRLAASSKRYRYLLWRPPTRSPFWSSYAWHYHGPLDVDAMAAGAHQLVGTHDLTAFAGSARPVRDATRTIRCCRVWADGPWLGIEVEADGFLYRTVRSIAGTLWRVGRGDLAPGDVGRVLRARDRAAAGPSLPARGLCLLYVRYPPGLGVPPPEDPVWPRPPGPATPV
jgi:tRNA pseudouridine38-40 synthase